jgi:hypothetical protein
MTDKTKEVNGKSKGAACPRELLLALFMSCLEEEFSAIGFPPRGLLGKPHLCPRFEMFPMNNAPLPK